MPTYAHDGWFDWQMRDNSTLDDQAFARKPYRGKRANVKAGRKQAQRARRHR